MYKLHLILKYLRKRRIAWVSLVAVTLCTALVLVVISVMGGWLRMYREAFRGVSGDLLVRTYSPAGFPHYQEMLQRLESMPEIDAAVPVIRTFGLVKVGHLDPQPVQVIGYPIERIAQVSRFPETLWRQYGQYLEEAEAPGLSAQERARLLERATASKASASFDLPLPAGRYRQAVRGEGVDDQRLEDVAQWPGMIVGQSVVGIRRDKEGEVRGRTPIMYEVPVKLITMGIAPGQFTVDMADTFDRNYWIVDDSRQGSPLELPPVYVSFDVLQRDLGMEEYVQTLDGEPLYIDPARTTELHLKVAEGADLPAVGGVVQLVVDDVLRRHDVDARVFVETWEERHAVFLAQVEKETVLVVFLFAIISVVAVFLIFSIFYMIVVEKTKDIGIIKSVGASGGGVAGIFLGYGLAIGIVGGAMGLLVGYLVVRNINFLHGWLAELMGTPIWSADFYLFDTIPNTMNPNEVIVIVTVAVLASVAGALVPAIRAAKMNPVEALRWE